MGLAIILLVLAVCWVKLNVYKLVAAETVEEQDILSEHNKYRKMHGDTALIWKGAKEMGIGLVARYIPNVNIEGQFERVK